MNHETPTPEARRMGLFVIFATVLAVLILPVHIEVQPATSQAAISCPGFPVKSWSRTPSSNFPSFMNTPGSLSIIWGHHVGGRKKTLTLFTPSRGLPGAGS